MKVNKFVLAALVLTIVICGYVYFFTGSKGNIPARPVSAPLTAASVVAQAGREGTAWTDHVLPPLEWKKDPFELPRELVKSRSEEGGVPLRVVAIMSGKNGPIAIIGSEVVRKGDSIYGEKVREIGKDTVLLGNGDLTRRLRLEEGGAGEVARRKTLEGDK